MDEGRRRLGGRVTFAPSNYDALAGADALVVVTDWNEYRHPDFARIKTDACAARSSSTGETSIRSNAWRSSDSPTTRSGAAGQSYESAHHGRGRFPRLAPLRPVPARRARGRRPRQLLTGRPDNIAHLTDDARFKFIRHDISEFTYVAGPLDGVLHFASPASPIDYLELPIETLKVGLARNDQRAGAREGEGGAVLPGVDVGGVRRSARASAAGELLGKRQPDRPAQCVRRGQAIRRSGDDGVSPTRTGSIRGSCASSTPTVRACGRATAASSRTSSSRRWRASRSRSTATAARRAASATSTTRSRDCTSCSCAATPAHEHRQSRRVHGEAARRDRRRAHGLVVADRPSAACRPTIPRSARRTSRARERCSAGSRACPFAKASRARSSISAHCCTTRRRLTDFGPARCRPVRRAARERRREPARTGRTAGQVIFRGSYSNPRHCPG